MWRPIDISPNHSFESKMNQFLTYLLFRLNTGTQPGLDRSLYLNHQARLERPLSLYRNMLLNCRHD